MTKVAFYHLQTRSLLDAIPSLAAKIFASSMRGLIKAKDKDTLNAIDKALWTFTADSFLPHRISGKGFEQDQGLLLSLDDENLNDANVLMLVDGAKIPDISGFERVLYIFDGNTPERVTQAREDWKVLKETEANLSYLQQNDQGGWDQKI